MHTIECGRDELSGLSKGNRVNEVKQKLFYQK